MTKNKGKLLSFNYTFLAPRRTLQLFPLEILDCTTHPGLLLLLAILPSLHQWNNYQIISNPSRTIQIIKKKVMSLVLMT